MHRNSYKTLIIVITLFAFGALLISGTPKTAYAAGVPTDNVSVDINVTALSEITVMPAALSWILITPGNPGGERNMSIKNTGSVNVSNVYTYIGTADNETARPYASSNPIDYSAGSLVLVHNSTNNSYSWVGRLEWNWSEAINNLQLNESMIVAANSNLSSWGFFRNASTSHVWIVAANSTNGRCNESGTVLAIEDDDDDGNPNTRMPNATYIVMDGRDTQFGYFSINRTTNLLSGMCIAVNSTCYNIYAYKYDGRSGFSSCSNFAYVAQRLVPNQLERIKADIWIPSGIPAGNLTRAWWYFIGN